MASGDMKRALNALVGRDILVERVSDAPDGFDARRSADTRCYEYAIWNEPDRNVWQQRWMGHVEAPLAVDAMNDACQVLVGRHDFAAFRTHRTQDDPTKGTIRRVTTARWLRDTVCPSVIRFEIEADAFLRHMVRTIVGTATLIGLGKLSISEMAASLQRKERAAAGPTAPANGLTLLRVTY
jgi:tRNA pseudouridine38-40 synthase